jgi:tetratricopeptide (TPR) repeat protein
MIKLIRQFISAAKAGSHSGKGNKCIRQGKCEAALRHYQLALEYEIKANTGLNPVSLECISRTLARLGNYKEALSTAEKIHDIYKQLVPPKQVTIDSIARIERFISALKAENKDEITKILSI